jgi:NADPH:quinone reductase-like Zn-dependent oxidoreductase
MKAAIFDNPGLENLRVMDNVKEPQLTGHHDVLIRVKVAGVNPIDNFVVSGALPKLIPLTKSYTWSGTKWGSRRSWKSC